jgi:hypothetical protein
MKTVVNDLINFVLPLDNALLAKIADAKTLVGVGLSPAPGSAIFSGFSQMPFEGGAQQQARQTKQHSGPRDCLGMEKLARRHIRPMECGGEQYIEIEESKWRDQEIRFVYIAEFHRLYPLSSQSKDAGQYHPYQQNDRQYSEIFWHGNSPPDIRPRSSDARSYFNY